MGWKRSFLSICNSKGIKFKINKQKEKPQLTKQWGALGQIKLKWHENVTFGCVNGPPPIIRVDEVCTRLPFLTGLSAALGQSPEWPSVSVYTSVCLHWDCHKHVTHAGTWQWEPQEKSERGLHVPPQARAPFEAWEGGGNVFACAQVKFVKIHCFVHFKWPPDS